MRVRSVALALVIILLLIPALTHSSLAQKVSLRSGATLRMSNGGVWHLRDARMDFGGVGATARLRERSGGRVTGGLLNARRMLDSPSSVNVAGLGAQITTAADLGAVTITRGHVRHTLPGNTTSIRRYYDISPSKNNRGLGGVLTIHYADAELATLSESALGVFKSDDAGTTWRPRRTDTRDTLENTVSVRRIRSLSRWTVGPSMVSAVDRPGDPPGNNSESPRSAQRSKLASPKARLADRGGVRLTWTAGPRQAATFRVQRLAGTVDQRREGEWRTIGRGKRAPAKNGPGEFQFVDEDLPYAADTLSYRIGYSDASGVVRYSRSVSIARQESKTVQLKETFPNPARNRVTIHYAVPVRHEAQEVTLKVYDLLGREVRRIVASGKPGRHEAGFSVADLVTGVYVVRLNVGGQFRTRRLTVVR